MRTTYFFSGLTPVTATYAVARASALSEGVFAAADNPYYQPDSLVAATAVTRAVAAGNVLASTWDNLDFRRRLAPPGNYYRGAISNSWDFSIAGSWRLAGNTSKQTSGDHLWISMPIGISRPDALGRCFTVKGYTENQSSFEYFYQNDINTRYEVHFNDGMVAELPPVLDNDNIYYTGFIGGVIGGAGDYGYVGYFAVALRQSDFSDVIYPTGQPVRTGAMTYGSGVCRNGQVEVRGHAVQVSGNFYLQSTELGQVNVYRKDTMALVTTNSLPGVRFIELQGDNVLWANVNMQLRSYTLNSDGSLTEFGTPLPGLHFPDGFRVSADGGKIDVADGADTYYPFMQSDRLSYQNQHCYPGNSYYRGTKYLTRTGPVVVLTIQDWIALDPNNLPAGWVVRNDPPNFSTATHAYREYDTSTRQLLRSIGSGDYAVDSTIENLKFFLTSSAPAEDARGLSCPVYLSDGRLLLPDPCNCRIQCVKTDGTFDVSNSFFCAGQRYDTAFEPNKGNLYINGFMTMGVRYPMGGKYMVDWWPADNYQAFKRPQMQGNVKNLVQSRSTGRLYGLIWYNSLDINPNQYRYAILEFTKGGLLIVGYTPFDPYLRASLDLNLSTWEPTGFTEGQPTQRLEIVNTEQPVGQPWVQSSPVVRDERVLVYNGTEPDGFDPISPLLDGGGAVYFAGDKDLHKRHAGARRFVNGKWGWAWQVLPANTVSYMGDGPFSQGFWEVGNGITNGTGGAGSFAIVCGPLAAFGAKLEGWKGGQGNSHFWKWKNGLQVGVSGRNRVPNSFAERLPAGQEGNMQVATLFRANGTGPYVIAGGGESGRGTNFYQPGGQENPLVEYAAQPFTQPAYATGLLLQEYGDATLSPTKLVAATASQPVGYAGNNRSTRLSGWLVFPTLETFTLTLTVTGPARLWLDEALLIDAWTNQAINSFTGTFTPDSIAEGVAFTLETANGSTALTWQSASLSSQSVPVSAFRTKQPRAANLGIDLHEGFKRGMPVVDGMYGITFVGRTAGTYAVANAYTMRADSPDFKYYVPSMDDNESAGLRVALPARVSGQVGYAFASKLLWGPADQGEVQVSEQQLVDAAGKVIFKLRRRRDQYNTAPNLLVNGQSVFVEDSFVPELEHLQYLCTVTANAANQLTYQYGTLASGTFTPFDPTADVQNPVAWLSTRHVNHNGDWYIDVSETALVPLLG